ncbi:hypothetical protein BJ138DRAFT_1227794 [Hygrophoropsis aurantiaca]|uniref:Uncharacterized protein n=1 Tax=Hygrophoropsis aurantiaca TaxID=72124 RepID=A0ACB7ZX03_9AGAM|nr:hypothetical protein BJ138DRAFT_1227794 [Hygrophoropsis aurantiaca]
MTAPIVSVAQPELEAHVHEPETHVDVLETHVDVLIIGAGPAGLVCQHTRERRGQRPDRRPATGQGRRGPGGRHPAEVLQLILSGCVLAELRPRGAPDPGGQPDAYVYNATPRAIKAIFLDSMKARGLTVEWPVVPTSIALPADEDALRSYPRIYDTFTRFLRACSLFHTWQITLSHLDPLNLQASAKTEVVRAKYVVGADGAHSLVSSTHPCVVVHLHVLIQHALRTPPTQPTNRLHLGASSTDTDFPDIRNCSAIHSTRGACMVIPREGDVVRLYIQLAEADLLDPGTGRVDKARMSPGKLLEVARKSFCPYKLGEPREFQWCSSAVFLFVCLSGWLPDPDDYGAPLQGQGMNASMNDTHNLGARMSYSSRTLPS